MVSSETVCSIGSIGREMGDQEGQRDAGEHHEEELAEPLDGVDRKSVHRGPGLAGRRGAVRDGPPRTLMVYQDFGASGLGFSATIM